MNFQRANLSPAAILSALALLLWPCAPAWAASTTVSSLAPDSVVTALQNAGYRAKLYKSDDGDPRVDTASGGNTIIIAFVNCTDHVACTQIEFLALWDCADQLAKCKTVRDDWNSEEEYSHAIITGGKIVTYYHMLFDKAGISPELFITNIEFFARDATALEAKF